MRAVLPGMELFANLFDFIDLEAEQKRIDRELEKADKLIGSLEKKLANQSL